MLVLLLLFGLVCGGEAQAPCCYPPQWAAQLDVLVGYHFPATHDVGKIEVLEHMEYDYTNQKLSFFISNRAVANTRQFFFDYKQRLAYEFLNHTCTTATVSGEFPRNCIPDSATFLGTSFLGIGNETLEYNTFRFQVGSTNVSRTVTKEGCIPISETAIGSLGPTVEGVIHTSYSMFLNGEAETKTPTDCTHTNRIMTPGDTLASIIG